MTNLDIYVFKGLQKAYSQGFLDGMDSAHSYGTENNFEEVLDEVLFCQEYAEVAREQLLTGAADDDDLECYDPDPDGDELTQ